MSLTLPTFEYINCTLKQGVAEIVLNRVDKHNAFDEVMISEMRQALTYFARLDTCHVLVLRANGKHFSAGADLNSMAKQAQMNVEHNLNDAKQLANLMSALDTFPKPTLALVQGAAFGGALGLICCCDIAIATEHARFCFSEVKLGLIPAVICPYVTRTIGQRATRRYMLSAESFGATKAQTLQLIHEIDNDLNAAAEPIVSALLANGPKAMANVKTLLAHLGAGEIDEAVIDYTSEHIARIRVGREAQEGLSAFFDKRPPSW